MLAGVISTQTYLQALFTARDGRTARRGALVSALIIPPLGLLGVAVGLAMRGAHPGIDSAQALPLFIIEHFPPAFAGIAFATLLVAALGTAAGLILGVGTTLSVDFLARWRGDGEAGAGRMRAVTLVVLLGALGLMLANLGSVIIEWSFLSMGLRGATLCLPLLASLALGGRAPTRGGAVAIVAAPVAVIVAGAAGWTAIPPLWTGLIVSLGAILAGVVLERGEGNR
jgi:SSS family solute:Na+ symporter